MDMNRVKQKVNERNGKPRSCVDVTKSSDVIQHQLFDVFVLRHHKPQLHSISHFRTSYCFLHSARSITVHHFTHQCHVVSVIHLLQQICFSRNWTKMWRDNATIQLNSFTKFQRKSLEFNFN